MKHGSETARFLSACIDESRLSHRQIAMEMGFDTSDDISMIKTGVTKLPISKIGLFARVFDTDPVELLSMCLQEYFPETWESISPFLDTVLTPDELSMVKALRSAVGGPYVMALTAEERKPLNEFLRALRCPVAVH